MPKNKDESDFELNYVSPAKNDYQVFQSSRPSSKPSKPVPPPRYSLDATNMTQIQTGPSSLNDNYLEPEAYCEPRDQVR